MVLRTALINSGLVIRLEIQKIIILQINAIARYLLTYFLSFFLSCFNHFEDKNISIHKTSHLNFLPESSCEGDYSLIKARKSVQRQWYFC